MLRKHGVVGKFVEFFGDGLAICRWPTARRSPTWRRSTAPRCGFFPVDAETCRYLRFTAAARSRWRWSRPTAKAQGLFWTPTRRCPSSASTLSLDLGHGRAEPRRPEAPAGPRAARSAMQRVPRRPRKKDVKDRGFGLPATATRHRAEDGE
jgi:aconitate hydratase